MASRNFETIGLWEEIKKLREVMTDDPDFQKRINAVVRNVLKDARKTVMNEIKGSVLENDPRSAYKAVRTAVYRRILGGQINILNRRKAGSPGRYEKQKKGLPKRGGNRWGISDRTLALEGYTGIDRGFILRFVNAGTADRAIHTYTDRGGVKHNLHSGGVQDIKTHAMGGNRGRIKGRNFFGPTSVRALEKAVGSLQCFIDEAMKQEFA